MGVLRTAEKWFIANGFPAVLELWVMVIQPKFLSFRHYTLLIILDKERGERDKRKILFAFYFAQKYQ